MPDGTQDPKTPDWLASLADRAEEMEKQKATPEGRLSLWQRYKASVRHDFSIMGDMARAIPREAINLFNETTNFFNDVATGTAQVLKDSPAAALSPQLQGMKPLIDFVAQDTDALNAPQVVPDYKTTAGQFIGVATRFGLGIATLQGPRKAAVKGTGMLLGRLPAFTKMAAKYPRLAGILSRAGPTSIEGGILDAAIFDPNEDTLAELIGGWSGAPGWTQTATAWLMSDADDTRLEKRMKNFMEGMLLGGLIDFGMETMRGLKYMIKAGDAIKAGADKAAGKLMQAADDSFALADEAVAARPDDVVEVMGNQVVPRGTRPEAPPEANLWDAPEQPITSKRTARKQVAAGFGKVEWTDGTKNIDIGGGPHDLATEQLAGKGVDSKVFDPFNRDGAHNAATVASHGAGKSDTATLFNVLNVIDSPEGRHRVLLQAADALKDDGKVYIQTYEGGTGVARTGVGSQTGDGWQNNKATKDYLAEVREVFPDAQVKKGSAGKIIEASRPPRGKVVSTHRNAAEAQAKAASINRQARVAVDPTRTTPKITINQEARILATKEELANAPKRRQEEILQELSDDLNLSHLLDDDQEKQWVAAIMHTMGNPLEHRKVRSNKMNTILALDMIEGVPEDEMLANLSRFAEFGDTMPQQALGFRLYLNIKAGKVGRIAKQLEGNMDDIALNDALGRALDDVFNVAERVSRGVTGAARTVQQQKQDVWDILAHKSSYMELRDQAFHANIMSQREALDVMSGLSPRERLAMARKLAAARGSVKVIQRIVVSDRLAMRAAKEIKDPSRMGRVLDAVNAYQINGLLASPRTHSINFFSNAVMAVSRPMANVFGGAVHAAWTGLRGDMDLTAFQKGVDLYTTSWNSVDESWRLAKEAFITNEVTLDPFRTISEIDEHMVGSGVAHAPGDLRTMTSWSKMKSLFWYPMRGLKAGDEMFKQIAYRSEVASKAMAEARMAGKSADDVAASGAKAIDDNLSQFGEALDKQALQIAREQTFQQDLGKFGQIIQGAVDSIPGGVGRWLFPFIRTPLNIFKTSMAHTPVLNMAVKESRDALIKGTVQQRSEALGRVMMGTFAMGTTYSMYAAGNITGGGPKDPALRERWYDADNQPYSIKVGGVWFRYDRLEPLGTVMGLVPDFFDTLAESRAEGYDWGRTGSAVMFSVVNSLKDRTFARQLVTLMGAAFPRGDVPDGQAFKRVWDDLATRAIPLSALSRALATGSDPVIRETRGAVDRIMAAIPGMSHMVPPKRNVFGEPILRTPMNSTGPLDQALNAVNVVTNPMTISVPFDDDIHQELVDLKRGFQLPSEKIPGTDVSLVDINLRNEKGQTPYDRMMEIVGEGNLRGKIERKIRGATYGRRSGDNQMERGGKRWAMLNGIINGAHTKALAQVMHEFPELKVARKDYFQRLRSTRRRGAGQAGLQEFLDRGGR